MKKNILFLCLVILCCSVTNAATIYVNINQTATPGDGLSWGTAYKNIQSAIDAAVAGDDIWVAQGAYYSNAANNFVLVLKEGVAIYGGFQGGESSVDTRDWQNNPTTIYAFETNAIRSTSLTNASIIDGFIISAPNNNPTGCRGIYNVNSAPVIRNCTFQELETLAFSDLNGDGAAMYNDHSNPIIINCKFLNNTSLGKGGAIYNTNGSTVNISGSTMSGNISQFGGAIYNTSSDLILSRCVVRGNQYATVHANGNGGGIYCIGGNTLLTNTLIAGNKASSYGGGIYNFECHLTAINCTITGNTSSGNWAGPAIYNASLPPSAPVEIINNSIIWDNAGLNTGEAEIAGDFAPLVTNSIIKDGPFSSMNNNPEFKAADDYRLSPYSPALNAGSTDYAGDYGSLDLAGNTRVYNDIIDLGAYEAQEDPNIIINNGDAVFVGFSGTLPLSANDIKIGLMQDYQWEIRAVGDDAPADTTTYLINPSDIVPYKPVLDAQGITIDSNHLVINDLSKLPALMTLIAPDAIIDWAGFSGSILFNRIIEGTSTSNMLKVTFQSATLPVRLSGFSGSLQNGVAHLQWQSELEIDFKNYILEKSTDGKNYVSVATVAPRGSHQSYHLSVPQQESKAIYRLKLVDNNGHADYYTDLVTLTNSAYLSPVLAYPSPAKDYINFQVNATGSLKIFDLAGRLVKAQVLQVGINRIDLSAFSAGIYYSTFNGEKLKFIKTK